MEQGNVVSVKMISLGLIYFHTLLLQLYFVPYQLPLFPYFLLNQAYARVSIIVRNIVGGPG